MRTTIDNKWCVEVSANTPTTDAEKIRLLLASLYQMGKTLGYFHPEFIGGAMVEDTLAIADRLEELDKRQFVEGD